MRQARLAALAAVVVALAACGGSSRKPEGTSPKRWTAAVCQALVDWRDGIQTKANELQKDASSIKSLKEGRRLIVGLADDGVELSDEMLRKVDAAGTPAVDDGAKIKRDFRANLAKLRDVLVQAKDDAENIPVDTPDHFASASEKWGKDVFSHFESVSGTFDELGKKYKSDEIENAAKSEPACKDLSNS